MKREKFLKKLGLWGVVIGTFPLLALDKDGEYSKEPYCNDIPEEEFDLDGLRSELKELGAQFPTGIAIHSYHNGIGEEGTKYGFNIDIVITEDSPQKLPPRKNRRRWVTKEWLDNLIKDG